MESTRGNDVLLEGIGQTGFWAYCLAHSHEVELNQIGDFISHD